MRPMAPSCWCPLLVYQGGDTGDTSSFLAPGSLSFSLLVVVWKAGVPSTMKKIAFQECNDYGPQIQEKTGLKSVLPHTYAVKVQRLNISPKCILTHTRGKTSIITEAQ